MKRRIGEKVEVALNIDRKEMMRRREDIMKEVKEGREEVMMKEGRGEVKVVERRSILG